jgi:hypothetical protein
MERVRYVIMLCYIVYLLYILCLAILYHVVPYLQEKKYWVLTILPYSYHVRATFFMMFLYLIRWKPNSFCEADGDGQRSAPENVYTMKEA